MLRAQYSNNRLSKGVRIRPGGEVAREGRVLCSLQLMMQNAELAVSSKLRDSILIFGLI